MNVEHNPKTSLTIAFIALIFSQLLFFFEYRKQPVALSYFLHDHQQNHNIDQNPLYKSSFVQFQPNTQMTHSPSIAVLNTNQPIITWYGGSREGAKDVAIYTARYNSKQKNWHTTTRLITPEYLKQSLGYHVRKLGNPSIFVDSKGRVWLFFVAVSAGGWSMSSVYVIYSDDEGVTWSQPKLLKTSPFLNISTLVRGGATELSSGEIVLPVYHEFLGKFGELVTLDTTGQVVNKQRLSWGRSSLQPELIAMSKQNAISFLRYSGDGNKNILFTQTSLAGNQWTPISRTNLPNPNAAVAGLRLDNESTLLVYNAHDDERFNLFLAVCRRENCTPIHKLEDNQDFHKPGNKQEFSYPDIIRTPAGIYHVVYTWQKEKIKHVTFNSAWLKQQLRAL